MEANITLDSPVPYCLDALLGSLKEKDTEMVPGARGEKQGPYNGKLTRFIQRLETKQKDKRLNFMFSTEESLLSYTYMGDLCEKLRFGRCFRRAAHPFDTAEGKLTAPENAPRMEKRTIHRFFIPSGAHYNCFQRIFAVSLFGGIPRACSRWPCGKPC